MRLLVQQCLLYKYHVVTIQLRLRHASHFGRGPLNAKVSPAFSSPMCLCHVKDTHITLVECATLLTRSKQHSLIHNAMPCKLLAAAHEPSQ